MILKLNLASPAIGNPLIAGLCFCLLAWSWTASAATVNVLPGDGTLQAAIDAASDGDTLVLQKGIYTGEVLVWRSITLTGQPGSIIDGSRSGDVIRINAPDVTIQGLSLHNSGDNPDTEDSGVFITKLGDRALIKDNKFEGNLIGVYLKGPDSAVVIGNVINGSQFHRMNDRGNGVYLWNTPGSRVEDNDIRYGRDGIFVATSRNNTFHNNRFSDLRFAIHYMYTQDSVVTDNSSTRNHSAYALMFSDRLKVSGNRSHADRDRGLFLNYVNQSVLKDNYVSGGVEKCVFIYNANMNSFSGNQFNGCDIGVHFTAGSERNEIHSNTFTGNKTQVKYVGTRHIEWSKEGRGNYWSDNPAFDLNDDGIADRTYRPNNLVDQVVWKYPTAKLLLGSPVMQMLRWAQSEFPTLHPGGVRDSAPLMQPPGH